MTKENYDVKDCLSCRCDACNCADRSGPEFVRGALRVLRSYRNPLWCRCRIRAQIHALLAQTASQGVQANQQWAGRHARHLWPSATTELELLRADDVTRRRVSRPSARTLGLSGWLRPGRVLLSKRSAPRRCNSPPRI